jgi:Methyltransferase domain
MDPNGATTTIIANPFDLGNDELERFALEECIKRQRAAQRASVMVVPVGRGDLALKFANLGADVLAADVATHRQEIEDRILAAGLKDKARFVPATINNLPDELPGEPFDIVVVRHGLCSLRYEQARQVVRQILLKLRIGGKLYVSILGLHSELGDGYPGRDLSIDQRYSALAPEIAKKYGIEGDVCLYSERNLFLLLLEAGCSVLRTMTTTYGNVKGVAVRV